MRQNLHLAVYIIIRLRILQPLLQLSYLDIDHRQLDLV